jgi:hypothetical protein
MFHRKRGCGCSFVSAFWRAVNRAKQDSSVFFLVSVDNPSEDTVLSLCLMVAWGGGVGGLMKDEDTEFL